jgi:hypothetical protein
MAKLSWSTFIDRYANGHLVAAGVPSREGVSFGSGGPVKPLHALLAKLLTRLAPAGDYALSVVRDPDPEVHVGFQKRSDADRLATTVCAEPTDRYSGWETQRFFILDPATGEAIAASLAVDGELDER